MAGLVTVPLCLVSVSCITTGGSNPGADDAIRFPKYEEYYHRGRERVIVNNVAGAIEDFETCIGLRKGVTRANKVDDWQVRTHGMHILDSYFPNRELGICYHVQGDDANALKYLQISTNQQASARAHFFINKIKKAQAAGAVTPPPAIATAPVQYSRLPVITLTGTATSSMSVSKLDINGEAHYIELASPTVSFAQSVPLKEGLNELDITAEDIQTQETVNSVRVIGDFSAPVIALISAEPEGDAIRVKARCSDTYGLSEARLDGASLQLEDEPTSVTFETLVSKASPTLVIARDLAGNESLLDLLELLPSKQPHSAFNFNPDRSSFVVHEEYFYFDGRLDCPSGIASVSLNGKALVPITDSRSTAIRFKTLEVLQPGENTFLFTCTDRDGKKIERTVKVTYTQPIFVNRSLRLGTSIPPLFASRTASEGYAWQSGLINVMNNREHERFNLLTARPEAINAIIREKRVELKDLVNPDAHIRWEELNEADWFFNGRVIEHSQGVELRFYLADTSHVSEPKFVDIYIDREADERDYYLKGLLSKIERFFPVVEGQITRLEGNKAHLNLGENQGIFEGARFIVIAPGETPGMANGSLRKVENQVVEMVIDRVYENSARAKVLGTGNKVIALDDYVYAR